MSEKVWNILLAILVGAFLIVSGVLLWRLIRPSEPETTPPPTTPSGDAWERIQSSGKIIVGTSADYPPFQYYDSNYQLTGFDIALMQEVALQMGVQVEWRDMTFEGLGNALQVDQIDAAISAISVDNDRRMLAYFSQIYYVSDDGILTQQNSTIQQITSLLDMTPYRIGVQKGSVYEKWIRVGLVETNLMPAANLHVYTQTGQAMNDLRAGFIDLVVADLQPALTAVNNGGVRLVGQSLNRQEYGIAMKSGQDALQAQINAALTVLQNTGRINQLVTQYMGVLPEEIVPPPTAVPSATAVPTATPPACTDSMRFVQDLNLDDQNMSAPPVMPPGTPFQKGWRVQNVGTCTWDNSYYLAYLTGNSSLARMNGQPTLVPAVVLPGQFVDLWVNLVSPATPGVYQGFWGMFNREGRQFGDRIWVGIQVPAPATNTPQPTQTPSPNISFTADRTSINQGQCALFSWNVTGAQAVFFYAQGQPWESNPVPAQGTRTECPSVTTTYELRVNWPDGRQEVRQITISVTAVPTAPVISQFLLVPEGQVLLGQCVEIRWAATGNINDVTIQRQGSTLWSGLPISGVRQDCPPAVGSISYTILVTGPGGNTRADRTIQVTQPATQPPPPTPTTVPPTPAPIPPAIDLFTVSPEQIEVGGCVSVRWRVTGETRLVQLKRNGVVIMDGAGTDAQISDCLTAVGATTYSLDVTGLNGEFVTQQASVQVQAPVDPNAPLTGTNWQLQDYYDGNGATRAVLAGTQITAVFDTASNVSGSAGCNTYNGIYQQLTIPNTISIHQVTLGRIACESPEGIMEQEQAYINALTTVTQFQITGNSMEMRDNTGRVVLRFQVAPGVQPR